MRPILVTGATGTLGHAVTQRLLSTGYEVRGLSRRPQSGENGVRWTIGDLRHPESLADVVRDVSAVIHCATNPASRHADVRAAGTLIDALREAGSPHLIYISIVGIDRVPLPYYRAKLQVEQLIENSGLPYTIQRATQFHDLVFTIIRQSARLPLMPIPAGVSVQPVDKRDVADRLAELARHQPGGMVPDMGGPEVRTFADLARAYLSATGRRRALIPIWLPGKAFRGYRAGGHLAPDHAEGRTGFETFLAEAPLP